MQTASIPNPLRELIEREGASIFEIDTVEPAAAAPAKK
jgi:hypothetical protein